MGMLVVSASYQTFQNKAVINKQKTLQWVQNCTFFLLYRVRLRSKYANNVFVTKNKKGHADFKIRRKVFTKKSNQQRVPTTKLLKSVYPNGLNRESGDLKLCTHQYHSQLQ
jgi:hypothetical protein